MQSAHIRPAKQYSNAAMRTLPTPLQFSSQVDLISKIYRDSPLKREAAVGGGWLSLILTTVFVTVGEVSRPHAESTEIVTSASFSVIFTGEVSGSYAERVRQIISEEEEMRPAWESSTKI